MNQAQLHALLFYLAREVARLHGLTAALSEVVQGLMQADPKLASFDASHTQKAQWQAFYERLEQLCPELAAHLDNRSEEAME
ncbi:hypothetical protein UFOVP672_42 [uncultured Caudovirales phage]|uniref:Uncharacterized protein n=1 Tax=uncultured Caudovirales phage TaxID=2100421 RepID=A0A6J5NDX4_9CAUD|nr:hypothetical protein UFOVP672_42 [uncultured Caudovirales phage]